MKNLRTDLSEVLDRTQTFYQMQAMGSALLKVKTIQEHQKTSPDLTKYAFPQDMQRYLDDCYQLKHYLWSQRLHVIDDHIPALGPWYGIAEHSAFLGGTVEYGKDTSWIHPVLDSCDQLDRLSMDENNSVYRMVIDGITYIKENYGNDFWPMTRGTSGVLEIANTLRGNDFFMDFYDDEDALERLLDFCEKAIIWYFNKQLEAAKVSLDGMITGFGEWLPGHSIGQMSEDTTTMISQDLFDSFAKPHTQAICDQFDHSFIHIHALSEHCLPSLTTLRGIQLMELSSDPNTDRAIDVYIRNREKFEQMIPVLNLTREEILRHMDVLKSQKTVIWYDAETLEDALDMCALVRRELPVR